MPVEIAGEDSVEQFGEESGEESGQGSVETFAEQSGEASTDEFADTPIEAPVQVQPAEPIRISAETSAETSVEIPVETQVQALAQRQAAETLPKAASEPSVSTPDAWLERRLRVFERALSALEAKAVTKEREQARVIAELEEKLSLFQAPAGAERPVTQSEPRPAVPAEAQPAPAKPTLRKARVTPIEDMIARPEKSPEKSPETPIVVVPAEAAQEEPEQPEAAKPAAEKNPALLDVTPARAVSLSREEMAEMVNLARGRAKAAPAELDAMPPDRSRIRWLAVAGLSLLVLFLFIGL